MYGRKLTPREAEIIDQLLAQRGITEYEFVQVVNEGKDLPGSSYHWEIELLSAIITTPTTAYSFWLDWIEGNYAFKHWQEVDLEKIRPHAQEMKRKILTAQQRLRENGASTS